MRSNGETLTSTSHSRKISVSPQEKIAFFIVFPGERSAIETPPGFLRHLYIAIVKSHKMPETTWPQNKTSLNIN